MRHSHQAAALGLSLLATAAAGAEPPRAPETFGAGVTVVSLPVFVVDGKGRAWRGLGADDFEIEDDGKRVPLVSFEAVDTTSPEEQQAIREAPAARRHFLLLFDLSFTERGGLHRAREAARDLLLRRLASSDLAAVATFDVNRGLRMLTNFSEDRALVRHAVDTLGVPSLSRISDPLGLAEVTQAADLQAEAGRNRQVTSADAAAAQEEVIRLLRGAELGIYRRNVLTLVGSLEDLGKALRSVEGRKQVVLFSAGFDSQLLQGSWGAAGRGDLDAVAGGDLYRVDERARWGDTLVRDSLRSMARTLARADCVLHTVDVSGLTGDDGVARTDPREDPGREVAGRDSLNYMAAETGGRFFRDANDLSGPLAELLDMTSRYYVLGYQPQDLQGPGKFHKIQIKVRRKDARVSHRAGFNEREPRSAQTPLQRHFEAAQLVMTGVGWDTLRMSALCLPFPAAGERQTLGVVLQVDRGELPWQSPLALELYGYAVAEDGSVADHLAQAVRIDLAQADPESRARGVAFLGTFALAPGRYTIRLMVQESGTGAAGVQFVDVTVPPHDPKLGFLLPPVVVDEAGEWVVVPVGPAKGDRPELPLSIGGRLYLPRASFRLRGATPETLAVIGYDPPGPADTASSGLEIQTSATDAAGASAPPAGLRIQKVHREPGGRRTYVFAFMPEGWTPGDYTLRVGVGEAGTQLESYTRLHLKPEP